VSLQPKGSSLGELRTYMNYRCWAAIVRGFKTIGWVHPGEKSNLESGLLALMTLKPQAGEMLLKVVKKFYSRQQLLDNENQRMLNSA